MRNWIAALAAAGLLAAPAAARTPEQVAEAALKAAPVWDGHNDLPIQLRNRRGNMIDGFDLRDTRGTADPANGRAALHTDIARLREGRVGAQFWSVYVSTTLNDQQAVQAVMEQIDVTRRLIARYPQDLQFTTTSAEVERAMRQGKVASLLGMEGGQAIGNSLAVLRQMHELGVRYMTLTHSTNTSFADSATDAPVHGGLNDFGRSVVAEMQRIGMLVDLSHVSEATMADVLDVAKAPVIFSHSGALAVNSHPRNVPDGVLGRMKANGGLVMVYAVPEYVSEEVRLWTNLRAGERARLEAFHVGDAPAAKAALAKWETANPAPRATVSQVADHIDHVVKLSGIDHVGIGADLDGISWTVQGLDDVSHYPALFAELARRGYSQGDLEKIASKNMLRVMRAAEAYAVSVKGQKPIETPVAF